MGFHNHTNFISLFELTLVQSAKTICYIKMTTFLKRIIDNTSELYFMLFTYSYTFHVSVINNSNKTLNED